MPEEQDKGPNTELTPSSSDAPRSDHVELCQMTRSNDRIEDSEVTRLLAEAEVAWNRLRGTPSLRGMTIFHATKHILSLSGLPEGIQRSLLAEWCLVHSGIFHSGSFYKIRDPAAAALEVITTVLKKTGLPEDRQEKLKRDWLQVQHLGRPEHMGN